MQMVNIKSNSENHNGIMKSGDKWNNNVINKYEKYIYLIKIKKKKWKKYQWRKWKWRNKWRK